MQRLTVTEHELLQIQVQLYEIRKENVIIKRRNIQLTGNLEDEETLLGEIQLNLESSHVNDSSVVQGDETERLCRCVIVVWFLLCPLLTNRYPDGTEERASLLQTGVTCVSTTDDS